MSKTMNIDEFHDLQKYVIQNHGMYCNPGKNPDNGNYRRRVKYMSATLDTRDGKVFGVTLYGSGVEVSFPTTNEFRNHPKTLKERILDYLNAKDEDHQAASYTSSANQQPSELCICQQEPASQTSEGG